MTQDCWNARRGADATLPRSGTHRACALLGARTARRTPSRQLALHATAGHGHGERINREPSSDVIYRLALEEYRATVLRNMRYENILYSISSTQDGSFEPWKPSTWPDPPKYYDAAFQDAVERIFWESLLEEIFNVISDAPTLEHRGHVVALSLLCAIDALSSYAFEDRRVGTRYIKYIEQYFPQEYRPKAKMLYDFYRNSITHSWNLFQAEMTIGYEPAVQKGDTITFGLKNLYNALCQSVEELLKAMKTDALVQQSVLKRYRELKDSARA